MSWTLSFDPQWPQFEDPLESPAVSTDCVRTAGRSVHHSQSNNFVSPFFLVHSIRTPNPSRFALALSCDLNRGHSKGTVRPFLSTRVCIFFYFQLKNALHLSFFLIFYLTHTLSAPNLLNSVFMFVYIFCI